MREMFSDTKAFNADISKWDVSSVTDMRNMFSHAELFDVDISSWDVSRVTNMDHMFYLAFSFKQKLCGEAWVNSKATKAQTFGGTAASIAEAECIPAASSVTTQATSQYTSHPPMPGRELIVRTPSIASRVDALTKCPKCGTFAKSGRKSCCAPGGAWFKNCGGARNKSVGHKWFEGVAACKRKCKTSGTHSIHSHWDEDTRTAEIRLSLCFLTNQP